MGTRSLLGYELPNGKIYAQYLQFDGYPEGQGKEYYLAILRGFESLNSRITTQTDQDLPKEAFQRIKAYLNEAQYKSGHSIGEHQIYTDRRAFFTNQRWNYLFCRNGDFIIKGCVNEEPYIIIPWNLTRRIYKMHEHMEALEKDEAKWWDKLNLKDYRENKKVLSWKDPVLHMNDDLDHDSSKHLLEERLKGGHPTLDTPILSLDYGEILGFPEQGEQGWRNYSILTIGGTNKSIKSKSMFSGYKEYNIRNRGTIAARINFKKEK